MAKKVVWSGMDTTFQKHEWSVKLFHSPAGRPPGGVE